MLAAILVLIVAVCPGAVAQEADLGELEREARSAAYRYESLLRRRAPYRYGGIGGECDEVIGRFCFRFGDETPESPPEPEHPDVTAARRRAVRAYRRWLSRAPSDAEAAGGLIRYLIEDGRAEEAVPVARTHAWADPGTESLLLLGLSLHAVGEFVAAEASFDSARGLASPSERADLDDVRVLLASGERGRYGELGPEARGAYNRRFWAFSDPSLRVPGNERRSAHYARHGWIRILDDAPRAAGMLSWGDDHEEIVLRYGIPRRRERVRRPPFRLQWELTVVSLYDPRAVSFVPPALATEGIGRQPEPGGSSPLERDTVRSSYAPLGVRRIRGLAGQVTRLPTRDGWTLRMDALLPPDTASPAVPVAPEGLLAVLDSLGGVVSRARAEVEVHPDSGTVVRAETTLPPDAYTYQMEVGDDSTGLAGWARYRIDGPGGDLALSDPLLARPPADTVAVTRSRLVPFPTRVVPRDRPVLVYAEVRGLGRAGGAARYAVEWWLERREGRSWLGRAARWVGRRLGLIGEEAPVRLRWDATSRAADPVAVAFTLDLTAADPGRYRLGLTVRDRISGREATSYRAVLVAPAGGRRGPDAPDRR